MHPVKSDRPDLRTDHTMFICAALVTIFIEGSREDRRRVMHTEPEPPGDIEREIRENFLVRLYGADPRFLDLKRAHHMVESGHRVMAWKMVAQHARTDASIERLTRLMRRTIDLWLLYRDGVARACGLAKD